MARSNGFAAFQKAVEEANRASKRRRIGEIKDRVTYCVTGFLSVVKKRVDSSTSTADVTPGKRKRGIARVARHFSRTPSPSAKEAETLTHNLAGDEEVPVIPEDFGSPLTRSRAHSEDQHQCTGVRDEVFERDAGRGAVHEEYANAQPVDWESGIPARQAPLRVQMSSPALSPLELAVQQAEDSGRFRRRSRISWRHPHVTSSAESQRKASAILRLEVELMRREWNDAFWIGQGFYWQGQRRMQMHGSLTSSDMNLSMYGMEL